MNDDQWSFWTCPSGPVLMSLKPGTANPYPESSADEEQVSFMKIQLDPPVVAAALKEVDLPGKVGRGPPTSVPPVLGDSSIELLFLGLPPGTTGLPGRQIPPRAGRPGGLAAGRHPDPSVDAPTLPGTSRETPANHRS